MNTVVIGSNGQLGRHVFETFKKKTFFFFLQAIKKANLYMEI